MSSKGLIALIYPALRLARHLASVWRARGGRTRHKRRAAGPKRGQSHFFYFFPRSNTRNTPFRVASLAIFSM